MLFAAVIDGADALPLGAIGVVVALLGMTAVAYLPNADGDGQQ